MDVYRVKPEQEIKLSEWDPGDISAFEGGKDEGKRQLKKLNDELEVLQELLFAEGKHKILVVLQGMDTSGKDGTIRHVFEGVNPQGVKVASFGKPTEDELAHDYLWRVHSHTPQRGQITIFNRSHYEDVLVVRVLNLVPEEIWKRRYHHIREFERLLADEGTKIIKFYLHIDREEQKERLQARLDEPTKNWKFNKGDLKTRALWDQYEHAYETAIKETSTEWAPWYVVPANRKWYRNLVVASIIVETLKKLKMSFPSPEDNLDEIVIE